jgi:hypothetical protein
MVQKGESFGECRVEKNMRQKVGVLKEKRKS